MHENNRQLSCQLAVIYEELCRAQGDNHNQPNPME